MACESSRTTGRKQEEDARGDYSRPFRAESSHRGLRSLPAKGDRATVSTAGLCAHRLPDQDTGLR